MPSISFYTVFLSFDRVCAFKNKILDFIDLLQVQKWLDGTTPSFSILYLKKSRGRNPVVHMWAGMNNNDCGGSS